MVSQNNNRTEEMFWSKRKQTSFRWLEAKHIGLVQRNFYPNIYVSESLSLY